MIWIDRAATSTITLGGIAVILAVLGIFVYLVIVVQPLLMGAEVSGRVSYTLAAPENPGEVLFAEVDEYRTLGLLLETSGEMVVFSARDGSVLETRRPMPPGSAITAFSRIPTSGDTAFGFADGTVRLGRMGFDTTFDSNGERRVSAAVALGDPFSIGTQGLPVTAIDYRVGEDVKRLALVKGDAQLLVNEVRERENLLTGEITSGVSAVSLEIPADLKKRGPPEFLLVTTIGDQLFLAWSDGTAARFDPRRKADALVERLDFAETGSLTLLAFLYGEQSILASDSEGGTRIWFRVPRSGATADGQVMEVAHRLASHAAPVGAVGFSARDKSLVTGAGDGTLTLHHMTSEKVLAELQAAGGGPILAAQISPKGDGLFALSSVRQVTLWDLDSPHPETSLRSIFGEVWYEGYAEPSFTWQSSSATDDFEPKLSLTPLVFGTLKATLYSMLFAVPIALSAAVYTSEFLNRKYRAPLKSTIEMMASLPSVVLGFLAALVLAPLVESWVLAVLCAFAVAPLSALLLGYVWQVLPSKVTLRLKGFSRLTILLIAVVGSVSLASMAAGPVERLLFEGDFKAWLDGRAGTATPGVAFLIWPLVIVALLFADQRYLAPVLTRRARGGTPGRPAARELARYLSLLVVSAITAWLLAVLLTALGFDSRESLFGTYVQRNALVVGFVMGFAVIPIIYTIAEDALSAVPQSLRSASLGCGATPWQTATRVILPVAASGIFSALMVGLGRAVGETMIVLMAAGNTPLMDLNIFNGLRTLSANIAVELPEAVKDGTLYRMLFLAALMLFLLTFVVNTVAELVRLRFRRKSYQL